MSEINTFRLTYCLTAKPNKKVSPDADAESTEEPVELSDEDEWQPPRRPSDEDQRLLVEPNSLFNKKPLGSK